MKKNLKWVKPAAIAMSVFIGMGMIGCGEIYTDSSASEEVAGLNEERVREESEQEAQKRLENQAYVAKAELEAKQNRVVSPLEFDDDIGEMRIASSIRREESIPTYIILPKVTEQEKEWPLVVLFAGFNGDHDMDGYYLEIAHELSQNGCYVVMFDAPGLGDSEEDNLAYTLTNIKQDALDVIGFMLDEYNVSKVGALGFDLGGRAIMEMMIENMFIFDAVNYVAPSFDSEEFISSHFTLDTWAELNKEATLRSEAKFGAQTYSKQWFEDLEKYKVILADAYIKAYKNVPSMVIYSYDDDMDNPVKQANFAHDIGAAAIEFSDGGHACGLTGEEGTDDTYKEVVRNTVEFFTDRLK